MCPTLFLSLFFGKAKLTPSLVHMDHVAGCSQISPTHGLLCVRIPRVKCVVFGVSFKVCSITSEYPMSSWNSSHVPGRRMSFVLFNLDLKGLATKIPEGPYYNENMLYYYF